MKRLLYGAIAVAIIIFGMCMVIWPRQIAEMSNTGNDRSPPSATTLLLMRIIGAGIAWLGAYALYAIVTRLQGMAWFPF